MGTTTMSSQILGTNRFAIISDGEMRGEVFASPCGWTAAVYTACGRVRRENHATREAAEAAVLFAGDGSL